MGTTRNIVPRANGEGSIGTDAKQWGAIKAKEIYINGLDVGQGIVDTYTKADQALVSAEEAKSAKVDTQAIYNAVIQQYGYPFTASSAEGMTDTTKIYVYVGTTTASLTNGHWYYNDGNDWADGGVYNSVAVDTDDTLTVSDAPADAKATGDAISGVKAEMALFGVDDLLWDNCTPSTKTQNGVTYTVDNVNKTVTVSSGGQASSDVSVLNFFYGGDDGVPLWLEKGKEYNITINSENVYIQVNFHTEDNPETTSIVLSKGSRTFILPNNVTYVTIRLVVNAETVVNEVVRPVISLAKPLSVLQKNIDDNYEKAFKHHGAYSPSVDFDTLTERGDYFISSNSSVDASENNPLGNKSSGILSVYTTSGGNVTQVCLGRSRDIHVKRTYLASSEEWSEWKSITGVNQSLTSNFGVKEYLWDNWIGMNVATAGNGVTFVRNIEDRSVTIKGVAETQSVVNFVSLSMERFDEVWNWLEKGKTYYANINTDENVFFEVAFRREGDEHSTWLVSTRTSAPFVIPEDAVSVLIRLSIPANTELDTVVHPFISDCKTLYDLTSDVEDIKQREEQTRKTLKILFIGASTLQDACTYAPFICDRVAPELDLTMGLAYRGSTNISDGSVDGYNTIFDDPTKKLSYYSLYTPHADNWVNSGYQATTVKEAIDNQAWDVIVVDEAVKYNAQEGIPTSDTAHYAKMGEFIDKIVNYVKRPLKFGAFFHHTRYSTNDYQTVVEKATTFSEAIEQYRENILDVFPVQFFVPSLTAYWNARGTVLDQYGDAPHHHMLADYAHCQEGIGCLVGGYTTALKILEVAGINDKSILGDQIVIDDNWVISHAIPGKNPSSAPYVVGLESENIDRNRLIAQKCAIMAINKPFEISEIV